MCCALGGPSLPSRNGASNSAAAAGGVGGAGGDLSEFLSDDRVPDAPADDLLQRLRAALHTHTHALNEMRETLSDTASEAWADENYTLRLRMEPKDDVPILTMIHTDNAQFNKVTTVFAFLCEEIRNMKVRTRTHTQSGRGRHREATDTTHASVCCPLFAGARSHQVLRSVDDVRSRFQRS